MVGKKDLKKNRMAICCDFLVLIEISKLLKTGRLIMNKEKQIIKIHSNDLKTALTSRGSNIYQRKVSGM